MQTTYRRGKIDDCHRLAELDNLASGGAVEYLFRGLVPGLTPVEIVAHSLKDDTDSYSYKSTIVAEHQDAVIGFSLSYPSEQHKISKKMRDFFPPDRLEHFHDFFSSRVEDSLYLDGLYVNQEFRNSGIGRKLIDLTVEKAEKEGFRQLSLIVFADNTKARRLYEAVGFGIVKKIDLKPHELLPHKGGCLLMNYKFSI